MIFLFAGLLVFFQLLTCIFAKRRLVRWLPFLISLALTAFCLAMYVGSHGTNWGYIILIGLLGIVLLSQGLIIILHCLARSIVKR